jgi:two-component sensor histidine kinase
MRRLTLRARLGLLVLAGVLPLLAFDLVRTYAAYRHDRAEATRQALNLARGLALAVEAELSARTAMLEVLALSRRLAEGDLAAFRTQAEAVLARQAPGANILLLREDGQQVMNTALPPGAPLPRREYLENQRRVFATGEPSVSNVFFGAVLRPPLVAIDVPVRGPDGSVAMVLALNPTLDTFEAVLRRQWPGAGWIAAVFDRAGMRVARLPDGSRYQGQQVTPDLLAAWSAGAPEGILEAVSPEGTPTLTTFARLPETGWGVAVAVAREELTRPALRSALASLAVGLALLAAGLALAHLVARGVLRPVQALLRLSTSAENEGPGAAAAGPLGLPEADALAAVYLDETRRRRAATVQLLDSERRLRLVVSELNHRAKNALATVQALAMQTARGDAGADPARFTEAFTARLQTLARAHDLLTAFSWEGAALGAVVRAGLAPWLEAEAGGAGEPRIVLDCPCDLPLPPTAPGQVQALVMALHELATNATKHGALSGLGGHVEVTCRTDPGGLTAELEWRERGGPPVPGPPARRGFGTRLLERALAHDLGPGAGVALDFAPDGLRATIRFAPRATQAEPVT